jgi:hypothetical protein
MKGEHHMRTFLLVAGAALVLAAPAAAGGWATAGLAPPPDDIRAGETWNAQITILQHGQTPLEGASPAVIIRNGDRSERFDAMPTGKPGVYAAEVEFPTNGTWRYEVFDGFTQYGGAQTHTFAPVQVGPGNTGVVSIPGWTWGLAAAGILLVALLLLARRTRPTHAPVAQQ